MRNWQDLIVWQESHKYVQEVYKFLKFFPKEEMFGIISQIKRAVVSIPTNIVEGHSKKSNKEFTRFLYISRGSLEEVKYLLLLSKDLGFLQKKDFDYLMKKALKIGYLLNGLIKSLSETSTTFKTSNTPNSSNTSTTFNTFNTSNTSNTKENK